MTFFFILLLWFNASMYVYIYIYIYIHMMLGKINLDCLLEGFQARYTARIKKKNISEFCELENPSRFVVSNSSDQSSPIWSVEDLQPAAGWPSDCWTWGQHVFVTNLMRVPSGNLTYSYWKWPSRNSGFSHFSNGGSFHSKMWQFTRG